MVVAGGELTAADCSEDVAEIEARIATGKYPEYNVNLARQMLTSMTQLCGMMDEGTRAAMLEGFEDILPTKTEEELRAERKIKAAEAKAAREARKRERAEVERNKPAISPVLLAAPTAKLVATNLFDRDDTMYHVWLWDWDTYEGNLRVLYSSFPDRTQYGLPDWKFHVYVAEMSPSGETSHHLITSKQANDHYGLVLRRGHEEILYHRHVDGPAQGGPATFERWSISGQRMLSSADISDIGPGLDAESWHPAKLRVATSDGNALFEAIRGGNNRKDRLHYGWFKLSPGGQILGNGTLANMADNVGPAGWFDTHNGGGGLIVDVTPVDSTDLVSGLQLSAEEASLGERMAAHVFRERRALVVASSGNLEYPSVPIERDIMQIGAPGMKQPTSMAEIQSMMTAQQQWFDSLVTRYNANRATAYTNVGPHAVRMVKPTDKGYAYLTNVTANRKQNPPVHGPYIVEFDETGETNRIYLEALAQQMGIKLTSFAASGSGRFFLLGKDQSTNDSHIILIDGRGSPLARGQTSNAPNVIVEGIMADESGVWLYGHAYQKTNVAKVWIERIGF
jgi:hypothetical protein